MAVDLKKIDHHQVLKSVFDLDANTLRTSNTSTLVPEPYDQIDLTYVTSGNGVGEVETATYKSSAVTVATLTLSYNASNQLISVVRS